MFVCDIFSILKILFAIKIVDKNNVCSASSNKDSLFCLFHLFTDIHAVSAELFEFKLFPST